MSELLFVEDVERVSRFLERGLAAEGYSVVVVATGEQGFAHAMDTDFDLVILDVMLPGMSGKEVCRQLRARGRKMPVLVLTALDSTADKVECLRGGADDYLVKPFDLDELTARVDALIRRAHGLPGGSSAGDRDRGHQRGWRGQDGDAGRNPDRSQGARVPAAQPAHRNIGQGA